jgi:hypothetical protein
MTTTIFISSFVALIAMIGSKMVEIRLGKFPFWTNSIARVDEKFHSWSDSLAKKYSLWKKIAHLFVFEFLPSYTYELLVKMKDYVYKKYYLSSANLKGNRRMLRSNGSVSSFLQNITEKKEGENSEKVE